MSFQDEFARDAPASLEGGSVPSRDALVGKLVNGKYRVHKSIARGGMGRIYYATQEPLDRPVALKIVQADGVNEEESQFLKRFLLEASILAKLQHPNVVTLFDYGRVEGARVEMFFIAMEYLAGETLTQRLKSQPVLPTAQVLIYFRQILRGLREAHARGVVHRDLKPSNIILVSDSEGGEIVKLVDFGIGKMLARGEGADDLTQDGVMVGTPKYMAPEQFEGSASPASDLYSLATIAYQALTGGLPFHGNTLAEFMVAKFAHPIPRMRDVQPACDVSENLEQLVVRMLARRPEERPTLDEVSAHLAICEEEMFGTSGARQAMLARSGANGLPMSTSKPSVGALKVPYTIVAPMPAPTSPSGITAFTHPSMGQMTPRPMATSARPPAPPPSRAWIPSLAIAIVFALGSMAGVAIYWKKTHGDQPMPTAQGGAAPAKTDELAGPSPSFALAVDSTPSGADVFEGDKAIGKTPMTIAIDRQGAAASPRTFTIKKDGFTASTLTQGPSDGDVRTVVALAPAPTQTVKSRPVGNRPGGPAKGPPPAPQPDTDIRLKR